MASILEISMLGNPLLPECHPPIAPPQTHIHLLVIPPPPKQAHIQHLSVIPRLPRPQPREHWCGHSFPSLYNTFLLA